MDESTEPGDVPGLSKSESKINRIMKYGSVCSGIEAATMGWHPLGWKPAWFAEIDAFPSAVLKHHYPKVENRGDMTKFKEWPDERIDVLVGGTPCQSFSVAGLRKGLADPRGNLALVFLAIADRLRPSWVVWENVPGVLSQDEGRAFGSIVGGLGELGYGWAYRVLDAQYFRVPQQRRRVFLVGHIGDWRRAGAVLFERESMSWHPPPRRQARQRVAPTLEGRAGRSGGNNFNTSGGLIDVDGDVAKTLRGQSNCSHRADTDNYIATPPLAHCLNGKGGSMRMDAESETLIQTGGDFDVAASMVSNGDAHSGYRDERGLVTHALKAEGFDASEDGTGRGVPTIASGRRVRRLTPLECERLQGFPDGYTQVRYRGKPASDGPRYKALGNSMARPVMEWLGRRIDLVTSAVEGLKDGQA